ncbi:MAG: 1,4-dihydroxy-2-naphthoyl-CoA synthase, partial [Thermodesulfobacteriota bacterium]|nr:1,4-dihydroxy-2-naphthoyl-CoA synthase [Thermodesulfobacteriota bacterium]
VPLEELDNEVDRWCQEIIEKSPTALKFLKFAFNADTDHIYGIENLAGSAVRLYWDTEEAMETKTAFKAKRKPDFSKFL